MKRFLLKLLFFYKIFLGYFLGGRCRFYPSCSEYATEAIEKFATSKACLLIGKRLLRCNPLSKGGLDLVP